MTCNCFHRDRRDEQIIAFIDVTDGATFAVYEKCPEHGFVSIDAYAVPEREENEAATGDVVTAPI